MRVQATYHEECLPGNGRFHSEGLKAGICFGCGVEGKVRMAEIGSSPVRVVPDPEAVKAMNWTKPEDELIMEEVAEPIAEPEEIEAETVEEAKEDTGGPEVVPDTPEGAEVAEPEEEAEVLAQDVPLTEEQIKQAEIDKLKAQIAALEGA